eukprot:scaffold1128_cov41-Attheya_sp.AAC.4
MPLFDSAGRRQEGTKGWQVRHPEPSISVWNENPSNHYICILPGGIILAGVGILPPPIIAHQHRLQLRHAGSSAVPVATRLARTFEGALVARSS